MEVLQSLVNEPGWLALVALATVGVIFAIRRRSAALLLAIAFLALPAAQIWMLRPGFLFYDNSDEGIWLVIGYAGIGFAFLVMGVVLLMVALRPRIFAPGRSIFRVLADGRLYGLPLIIVAVIALNHRIDDVMRLPPPVDSLEFERQPKRTTDLAGTYRVSWVPRGPAPALDWMVPREAFVTPSVVETEDGPRMIGLRLSGMEPATATLTVHRDESTLRPYFGRALDSGLNTGFDPVPRGFWIDSGGGWKLLGLTCEHTTVEKFPHMSPLAPGPKEATCSAPAIPVMRYFPGLFGLSHHRLIVIKTDNGCDTFFRMRKRPVQLATSHACASPEHLAALGAGMALIDQLERAPPVKMP